MSDEDKPIENEDINAGDPRYDGFRFDELWVVSIVHPDSDQEGVAGVTVEAAIKYKVVPGMAIATDKVRRELLEQYRQELEERWPDLKPTMKHFKLVED